MSSASHPPDCACGPCENRLLSEMCGPELEADARRLAEAAELLALQLPPGVAREVILGRALYHRGRARELARGGGWQLS